LPSFFEESIFNYFLFFKMNLLLVSRALCRALASIVLALGLIGPTHADNAQAGKVKANRACAMCHGPLGQSMQPGVPNLAGQQEVYTIEQLRNYRSGKRGHEIMSLMAKPLTDRDIEDIAAWYGALKVEVSEP
jgi:cytochrome c553